MRSFVDQNSVDRNLSDFQSRIATTLNNYEHLLRELQQNGPENSSTVQVQPEGSAIVEKLLQEHRKNKSNSFRTAMTRSSTDKENQAEAEKQKENSPDGPLKNISNIAKNYVSFSPNPPAEKQEDQSYDKENRENIEFTLKSQPLEEKKSSSIPPTNIYGQLRISDLLQQSEADQKTTQTPETQRKSSFETLRVEDRLALRDIARSLKIHQMVTQKQVQEVQEIKEVPRISESSRILAEKSLRVQHNPDIIKRLLEDHKISQLRQEKEQKRKEKTEQGMYSFNPKINLEAQNIKRTIEDLFLWDKKKREKEENHRNFMRIKEAEQIRENLQASRISNNSREILSNMGRLQKKEPIENRLLREGNKIQAKKMKMSRENTAKIKPNHRKMSSTRSTVEYKPKITDSSPILNDIRRTLRFDEPENDHPDSNPPYFRESASSNHEQNNYNESYPFQDNPEECKPYHREVPKRTYLPPARPSEVESNEEKMEVKAEQQNLTQNPIVEIPIPSERNEAFRDIFNKYLEKKMAQKNSPPPESRKKTISFSEKEPENILKSMKIQDPLTLFEKKPYLLKASSTEKRVPTGYSSKNSEKQAKTPAFMTEKAAEIGSNWNEIFEKKAEDEAAEKEKIDEAAAEKEKIDEASAEKEKIEIFENNNNNKEQPSSESRLKSLFGGSKSYFQRHHLKNKGACQNMTNNDPTKNSLFCQLDYEERKKTIKASPESLLSSLRYRENKVYSYHANHLEIQDKSSEFDEKSRKTDEKIEGVSFYEKNMRWLNANAQKKNVKLEEKQNLEMRECTFQPISHKAAEEAKEKSLSTKRNLERSRDASNNLTNNDSYVEIYKKKRGNSLTARSLKSKNR